MRNLRIALKAIIQNRAHSFLGILSFAAGFSVCLITGLYLYNETHVDQASSSSRYIYRIVGSGSLDAMTDYELDHILSEKYPAIEVCSPVHMEHTWNYDVYIHDKAFYVNSLMPTTNRFFELFSIPVLKKTGDQPFAQKESVILTESTSKKLFGDEEALGQHIRILDTDAKISAIIPDFPKESSLHANILLNSDYPDYRLFSIGINEHIIFFTTHYLLLKEGYSAENLEKSINRTLSSYGSFKTKKVRLQPLQEIYFDTSVTDNNRHGNFLLIKILLGISIVIMLLSMINYTNYTLSTQIKKIKQYSIHKIHGAESRDIIAYYLSDALLWLGIAFILAIILVISSLSFINQIFPEVLKLSTFLKAEFIIGSALIFLTALLLSIIPVLMIFSRFRLIDAMKGRAHIKSFRIGKAALTFFQLTVSVILITVLIIIQKQVYYAQNHDLGFESKNLIHLQVPSESLDAGSFRAALLNNANIETVGISNGAPAYHIPMASLEGSDDGFLLMEAGKNFISTMKMKILQGRDFNKSDYGCCIINEALADMLGKEFIEGRKLYGNQIIGIVQNFNTGSIHTQIPPLAIIYASCNEDVNIRIIQGSEAEALAFIKKKWDQFVPSSPFNAEYYNDLYTSMYQKEELLARACSIFAIIAIIINCFGLLSQISLTTTSRTKEISIRKINGASVRDIILLLNRDFLSIFTIAFTASIPISMILMQRWLQSFAYRTGISWWPFALAGIIVLSISILTVSLHSRNAANRNPAETLRHE